MVASVVFGESVRLPNPFEAVYEAVIGRPFDRTGKTAPGMELPIALAIQRPRLHVRVEPKRWTVRTDHEAAAPEQLELLVDQYHRVHPYVGGLAVVSADLGTQWIEPFDGVWADLAGRYRRAFYRPGTLPEGSTDYSVLIDIEDGEFKAQMQSGPMERDQLVRDNALYGAPPNVPDRFLFVRYHYLSVAPPDDVDRFLADALNKSQQTADFLNERFQGAPLE